MGITREIDAEMRGAMSLTPEMVAGVRMGLTPEMLAEGRRLQDEAREARAPIRNTKTFDEVLAGGGHMRDLYDAPPVERQQETERAWREWAAGLAPELVNMAENRYALARRATEVRAGIEHIVYGTHPKGWDRDAALLCVLYRLTEPLRLASEARQESP